jgi:two-component system response regulator AtoC
MTAPKAVLIIDDEKNMQHLLQVMLEKAGYRAATAADGVEGLEQLGSSRFDFILCDIKMPRMDGLSFLKQAHNRFPEKTVIMMSAYGTIDTALEAMKLGAYDYISKPFKSDEVLLALKKAEERERLKEENLRLKDEINRIREKYSFEGIITKSADMLKVLDLVRIVAEHSTTVLITGESGTGKELIAKAIHAGGNRAQGPLVSINCGGIPETLLESEFFGYKKGAFTDAVRDKQGRFEEANGGTIFLDEIGELPLSLQVKLLRVLQNQEVTPLGGMGSRKIDVRIIAATSKDLKQEVEAGRFREDFFYRIHVMAIHLPPLRERRSDIPLLANHFIDLFNKKLGKNIEAVSSEALPHLIGYAWPGNIRELENIIERAMLLARGKWITPDELPPAVMLDQGLGLAPKPEDTLSIKKARRRLEKELIQKALKLTEGNRSQAAKILEISRPMLLTKIKAYHLGKE